MPTTAKQAAAQRSVEMARHFHPSNATGANAIVALLLFETWHETENFAVVAGVQLALIPFNVWVTLRLLKRLGLERAETIRAVVNIGCTPIIGHYAEWPIPVWLWIPYVALAFDYLGTRTSRALLMGLIVVVSGTAWLDGVPYIYPLASTVLAIFCSQYAAARLSTIKAMLAATDEQRLALAEAHAELKRESRARLESEAVARDMARQAGRAEMAAGVLHNVGNALNGFTVVSGLLDESARLSKASRLADTTRLLYAWDEAHGRRLASDGQGKLILAYLEKLAEQWAHESEAVRERMRDLQGTVLHIAAVIEKQQAYAKPFSVADTCRPSDLVHDAVVLTSSSPARGQIEVREHCQRNQVVAVDRHRVLQIVMNLLRNAEDAVMARDTADRRIEVLTTMEGGRLRVVVSDNGIGISPEAGARLFQYGYTTKEHGHGFGLHNSKLLASEVGGSLTYQSAGVNAGSTFTLELPVKTVDAVAA